MDPKLLKEIGLTEGETKVYLALLRLGETKTGKLAKEADVSSSKVYKVLDRLIMKGLAGSVVKGMVKYYSAVEPKRIIDYMEKKEKELQQKKELLNKLIPQLELEQKMGKQPTAVVYEGFKAVSSLFSDILHNLKKGDVYYAIGVRYVNLPAQRPFFHNYHSQRAKKGIKVMMLANHETRDNIEPPTKRVSEIRYLPQQFVSNMQITFYKNKSFIILWNENPTAFLIHGEETVRNFKLYFDTFWKIAKK